MQIIKFGDIGTPEILKRKGLNITIVDGQPRARINKVSPIHTMYERNNLTIAQFSAGIELYKNWVNGWGEYHNCEVRERVDGGGKEVELTTKQIHAMREYAKGKKAAGKEWDIINQVVINEIPLTKRGMGGSERQRLMYQFRRALDNIAKSYGFI